MPDVVIFGQARERVRHLVGSGLDLLETEDIGPFVLRPADDLVVPSPDAVDVVGPDPHLALP